MRIQFILEYLLWTDKNNDNNNPIPPPPLTLVTVFLFAEKLLSL